MPVNSMLHLGPAAGGDRVTLIGAVRQANRFENLDAVVISPRPHDLVESAKKLGIEAEVRKNTAGLEVVWVPPQEDRWPLWYY